MMHGFKYSYLTEKMYFFPVIMSLFCIRLDYYIKKQTNKKKQLKRPNQTPKKYLEWNILESGGIINVRKDKKAS